MSGAFIAELSDASGNFASPITIGYSYSSPIAATIPSGTPFGNNYKVRVRSYLASSLITDPSASNLSINTCAGIGIAEINLANGINIYPNPNQGNFYIDFKTELKNVMVEIQNVLGENLYFENFREVNADTKILINISEFQDKIYIMKIKTEKGELIKKIIKE